MDLFSSFVTNPARELVEWAWAFTCSALKALHFDPSAVLNMLTWLSIQGKTEIVSNTIYHCFLSFILHSSWEKSTFYDSPVTSSSRISAKNDEGLLEYLARGTMVMLNEIKHESSTSFQLSWALPKRILFLPPFPSGPDCCLFGNNVGIMFVPSWEEREPRESFDTNGKKKKKKVAHEKIDIPWWCSPLKGITEADSGESLKIQEHLVDTLGLKWEPHIWAVVILFAFLIGTLEL